MEKSKGGRPPKYKNKCEIEDIINQYFEDCKGHLFVNDDNEYVYDKYGQPVIVDSHPPTVTGLALALGFTSRQALLNYQHKKEFVDTITRAKSKIEEYTESRLFDKDGVNGAKFSLSNNFKGWNSEKNFTGQNEQNNNLLQAVEKSLNKITENDT